MFSPVDNGDPAPESPKHLSEFQPDVTAPEHKKMIRDLGQLHDRGVIQYRDIRVDVCRDCRASACVDEDLTGAERSRFAFRSGHFHRMRSRETCLTAHEFHTLGALQVSFGSTAKTRHNVPLSLAYLGEVNAQVAGCHPIVRPSTYKVCHPGACYHRFGGSTTDVDTRAPDRVPLDYRSLPSRFGQTHGQRFPGLTATDDQCVVCFASHL